MNQTYEEGYTITYVTPDSPQHAWKSLSLTVCLDVLERVRGNRFGFMTALKKFDDIAVMKKIKFYHIISIVGHSVRNEVSADWVKKENVAVMKPVSLETQLHKVDRETDKALEMFQQRGIGINDTKTT